MTLTEQLSRRMREVLLRRASGATAKMVAEELGISAGTVDVTYHRAVSRVRKLVDDSEEYRALFAPFRPGGARAGAAPCSPPDAAEPVLAELAFVESGLLNPVLLEPVLLEPVLLTPALSRVTATAI